MSHTCVFANSIPILWRPWNDKRIFPTPITDEVRTPEIKTLFLGGKEEGKANTLLKIISQREKNEVQSGTPNIIHKTK